MKERRKDPNTRESVQAINAFMEKSGKKVVRINGKIKYVPKDGQAD